MLIMYQTSLYSSNVVEMHASFSHENFQIPIFRIVYFTFSL